METNYSSCRGKSSENICSSSGGTLGKRKDRMKLSLGATKIDGFLVLCLDNSIVGRVWIRVSILMSSIPFIWWVLNLPPSRKLFSCNGSLTRLLLASSHPSSWYSQRGTFISILVSILGKRRKILFSIVAGSFSHTTPGDWAKNSIKQSTTFQGWRTFPIFMLERVGGEKRRRRRKRRKKKQAGDHLMWENSKISSSGKHFFSNTENLLLLLIC